jgi:hypothetical protein
MQINAERLLLEWQEEVAGALIEGFRQLFESSSQVLLEFADAAENNRLQRLFFDAQREFYLKEEIIVSEFERSLRSRMSQFTHGAGGSAQPGADTLSLVEVEDYERSLALETIAKRTVDRQYETLHALAQRLSALLGGRPIPPEEIPANPLQIIRIFDPASRKLDVEKEVRLVFYTLFDRYVMSRLGELYEVLNDRLLDLGILPNIRYAFKRPANSPAPQPRPRNDDGPSAPTRKPGDAGWDAESHIITDQDDEGRPPATAPPDGDHSAPPPTAAAGTGSARSARRVRPATPTSRETLAAISSLLMAKRQHMAQTSAPLPAHIVPSAANVGEAIADARVLEEAPHPIPMATKGGASKVAVDAALLMRVKGTLQRQRQIIKSLVGRDKLDRNEEDVIDIVGMLFEAMLNEKLLPNSVKTLLSHLHTRYLKIAVQSEDFLDNAQHPARRLFERMLDAGIRWVREENLRAGIYPQLQQVVTRLLQEQQPADGFFDEQIAYLDAAEKKLEQQSTAAEERTLEAERGRARLDEAKSIVRQTIAGLRGAGVMAPAVVAFLETTYADYLTLLLLRCNLDTDADGWNEGYAVGEALVAAAVHAYAGNDIGAAMREGLARRLQDSVGGLIPHHEQNIRRVTDALARQDTAPAPPPEPPPPPPRPDREPVAESEMPISEEDRRLGDKLMREAGNWFVMQRGDASEEQAVKLLWVNPHTRNMLFVDQHGAKVALMPADKVAILIREGQVRPMQQETSSFVARSLRRIRRALEDSVNA